jgi:hypothetical protein
LSQSSDEAGALAVLALWQAAGRVWFWVAQRFNAAMFPSAALAAEVADSTFSATSEKDG